MRARLRSLLSQLFEDRVGGSVVANCFLGRSLSRSGLGGAEFTLPATGVQQSVGSEQWAMAVSGAVGSRQVGGEQWG